MTSLPSKILSLARAGNPVRAWRLFEDLGLGGVTDDAEILTLKGRLLKDLAWRAEGDARAPLFRDASEAYLAAHALKADSYPLINAAALALFADDTGQSRNLASQVLSLIESNPDEGETPYWRDATRAEAQLLLGDPEAAQAALQSGIAKLPQAWEDHARTIEQFGEIIAAQGGDPAWLDRYRPPSLIHFSGLIGLDPEAPGLVDAIDAAFSDIAPGFAYGALAAGADILIAEAAIRADVQLHVFLPNSIEQFRTTSVAKFGSEWMARYDALIDQAASVECLPFVTDGRDLTAQRIETANLVAMGQAARNAEVLSSRAQALTIAATGESDRMHIALWREAGREVCRIETRRVAASGRVLGSAPNGGTATDCTGLVLIDGMETELVDHVAAEAGLQVSGDGSARICLGTPAACLSGIAKARAVDQAACCALQLACFGPEEPSLDTINRLKHIIAASENGQVLMDHTSAMIAKALQPGIRVEEVGELSSLNGPISLWSLAS